MERHRELWTLSRSWQHWPALCAGASREGGTGHFSEKEEEGLCWASMYWSSPRGAEWAGWPLHTGTIGTSAMAALGR